MKVHDDINYNADEICVDVPEELIEDYANVNETKRYDMRSETREELWKVDVVEAKVAEKSSLRQSC